MPPSKHLFSSPIDLDTAQEHVYDALVVGAGPAGSSAAYHLAKHGVDVLLVDREVFPREKSCGDAIMPPALVELAHLGLAAEVHNRFTQVDQIGMWVNGVPMGFHPVGEEERDVAYVAPRFAFDALLCDHAIAHGATWLDRVTVEAVIPDQQYAWVRGRRGNAQVDLRARVVVGADGSGSRLARVLRDASEEHSDHAAVDAVTPPQDDRARFTAMRGYMTGIEGLRESLEFYFGAAGTTYFWMFPTGQESANVGVIASMEQLRTKKTNLETALFAFLHTQELERRTGYAQLHGRWRAAPIAAGLRGTALFGQRLLCVGDAAALVDPSSAEGISGALWSGRLAAETVISALKQNDISLQSLSGYGAAVYARYLVRYDAWLHQ